MYPKLKYLYFLPVFVACLVASCASDAPESKQEEEKIERGAELSFTTADLTRAITTGFGEFAVYGDRKFQGDDETAPFTLFDKTIVKYQNKSWSYEGTQYWYPRNEHSFVAITPVSVLETGNPKYSGSRLTFTYTIPTTGGNIASKNDVTDILVATHRRLCEAYIQEEPIDVNFPEDNKPGPVVLKFNHILSLINIVSALDDDTMDKEEYIEFHKLELSGVNTKATFNILPAEIENNNQTDNGVIEVTGQEGKAKLTIEFSKPKRVTNNRETVSLIDNNEALIMLPQTFAADSEAKIILSYTTNNDGLMKQITLPLKNQKMESGKSYTYRFTIEKRGLHFGTTTITDWDMLNVGNIDAH